MEVDQKLLLQKPSPCQVEALKKCLEDHDGDASKCKDHLNNFKASCGSTSRVSEKSNRMSS
ncbi:hypothetical protein KP509_34G054000 [Ceratopteris richardii]|uniref:Uncharacterized protein n=1 Tax=Ceratopteris richardii TaxID=49495 RepID=A0A8T2QMB7_CERRI|nr:hypothetical protein KP509_34G054000 [Ceratopteris richardii]